MESGLRRLIFGTYGFVLIAGACAVWASLATWSVHDPSLNNATRAAPRNLLGSWGATIADLGIQSLGLASIVLFLPLAAWGWHLMARTVPNRRKWRLLAWPASVLLLAAALSALPQPKSWPLPNGLGGILGDFFIAGAHVIGPFLPEAAVSFVAGLAFFVVGMALLFFACGTSTSRLIALWAPRSSAAGEWANAWLGAGMHFVMHTAGVLRRLLRRKPRAEAYDEDYEDEEEDWEDEQPVVDPDGRIEPSFGPAPLVDEDDEDYDDEDDDVTSPNYRITRLEQKDKKKKKRHTSIHAHFSDEPYDPPSLKLLQQQPRSARRSSVSDEVLQENARELEGVLQDFGVKGEITNVRPGPVVTLYELEPAPGTKSSRVIGLADDIARSMSAIAARVAVVPGRNAIGIELPNDRREMVVLRELLELSDFQDSDARLALALGKTIGGRADHRRSIPHAPPPHRRYHGLGQVGRHQHHDLVAALPAVARAMQIHHDRSEDAGALRL